MAKIHDIKCPICGCACKLTLSDMIGQLANTAGMRGVEDEKPKKPSPESLNEENWIDLNDPCKCGHSFSFNIITGESRE